MPRRKIKVNRNEELPYALRSHRPPKSRNFDDIALHSAILRRVRRSHTQTPVQMDKQEAINMLLEPVSIEYIQQEIEEILERDSSPDPLEAAKGIMWALLISVHMWLILGIFVALLFK